MKITIRSAENADFPIMLEMFRDFSVYQKLPERMHNTLERMTEEHEFFHAFVAETGDKEIIGYATWFFTYFTWSGKGLYMDDLFVRSAFRSRGVGALLMERMISFARESKCHKLRWQVSHWNKPAISFYKKLGAEIDDLEKNCDLDLD